MPPRTLRDTPAVLTPRMTVEIPRAAEGMAFFQSLLEDFDGFRNHALIAEFTLNGDADHWEIHPQGDEFIYLLEGAATVILRPGDGRENTIPLTAPGDYTVVPKGVWHSIRCPGSARALFITPGEGTDHAGMPPE